MKNKGITLVALVITIIILLILAGITIAQLTGSGLFQRTRQAAEEYEYTTAEENLKLELSNILTEELGDTDLNDLDGMVIEGYETSVSKTGRIVSMTKNNLTYYFFVDTDFNITSLNEISGQVSGGSGTGNISQGTSELITEANFTISYVGSKEIQVKVEIPEAEQENVAAYHVLLNNKIQKVSEENDILVSGLSSNTKYNVVVQAIDKDGNIRQSNQETVTTADTTYLYNRGDYCEALTGGWKYSGGYSASESHWITYDDYMEIVCPAYTRTYITTNNAIDLTTYNTLTLVYESTSNSHSTIYITTNDTIYNDPITSNITEEKIDISSYTGEQYIHFNTTAGTLKLYEIYLEE